MPTICESFSRSAPSKAYDKGRVVVFAGGTGNPFFTTDSAAALRAAEMGCDALFKGTQVDGVYSADPKSDPSAARYERLSHAEVLAQGPASDGCRRDRACSRQQHSDNRLFDPRSRALSVLS